MEPSLRSEMEPSKAPLRATTEEGVAQLEGQLARIEAMVAGGAGARLCLYSGHDFTVFPLMLCLVPGWGEGAEDTIGGGLTQWTPFAGDVSTARPIAGSA